MQLVNPLNNAYVIWSTKSWKKFKKRKKTRKRLRLGDQMFHVAINEKKKQFESQVTSALVKEKYANFIKSILSSSSKMLLSILLILDR